jgi:hypothetical protein
VPLAAGRDATSRSASAALDVNGGGRTVSEQPSLRAHLYPGGRLATLPAHGARLAHQRFGASLQVLPEHVARCLQLRLGRDVLDARLQG